MGLALALVFAAVCASDDIVLENAKFRLTIGADATAKSLVVKATGEECLVGEEKLPICQAVQDRPFGNEIKLIWPNKRTAYRARKARYENGLLVVGFDTVEHEAMIAVKVTDDYMAFTLEKFTIEWSGRHMDYPQVKEFRVMQLPLRRRRNFGQLLNCTWDERAAVALMAAAPEAEVDCEERRDCRVTWADTYDRIRLRGVPVVLAADAGEAILDRVAAMERDYGLPSGVKSRRAATINRSQLGVGNFRPDTVDEILALAKRSGIRLLHCSYRNFFKEEGAYRLCGDYDLRRDVWTNGIADVKAAVDKCRRAGVLVGLHVLQTHIGVRSRYVRGAADPRLGLTRHFTLAKPVPASGEFGELEVFENPQRATMAAEARVLRFGPELFSYTGYTSEPPWRFTGVKRGAFETNPVAHPRGEIGGLLDMSEYGCQSVYADQANDLQDEVAGKIASFYNACGFSFMYFDGSEGAPPPCGINVPFAQYRVYRKLAPEPVFTEGAAKGHFGWHHLSGANAFDTFKPEVFKEMIRRYPLAEAPIMRQDFTRINFGWFGFWAPDQLKPGDTGIQADMYEYGTSLAAAWDCPVQFDYRPPAFAKHPRLGDILETVRRWEDVRARNWLTEEQKAAMRDGRTEHHLYVNEKGDYELHPIEMLPAPAGAKDLRGFLFERNGRRVLAYWHVRGAGDFTAPLGKDGAPVTLHAADRAYFETDLSREAVKSAYAAGCGAAADLQVAISLPGETDANAPISCAPFPDRLSAYVWRNWFCVSKERLAETVGATSADLTAVACEMGLPAEPTVEAEWTRKGYVTILRRNWHLLDYHQLMKLLEIDRAELNYRLLEDDFLFAKFGNVKPKCGELRWDAAANAKTRDARRKLAEILAEEGVDAAAPSEPRFGFLHDLKTVPRDCRLPEDPDRHFDLRLQFSYFADYADPLMDDEIGSFPEGLLARYAACGVNAVWLHVVLRTLAKDPFFVEFGEGCERRQRNLRKLVDRAAKYGIRVYLYLNEPRPMPCAFFEKSDAYRACRGTLEWRGIVNAMCTRSPEVRRWLGDAVEQVFRAAPGLGGVLTISGSENLTHCLAHGPKSVYENDPSGYCKPEKFCRRCEKLTMDESVADLNRVIADGVRRADPAARVIVWDWGWKEPGRTELGTVTSAIARLKGSGVSFMTVSERDKPIDVGGVAVRLNEYALSQVGPSELSLAKWRAATAAGLPTVAKAQVASSWEMSVVPYVPVMDNVAEHAFNLMKAGVKGSMLSWSCGCYPAPNLEVFTGVRTTDRSAADVLDRVAVARYGQKAAPGVRRVWTMLSKGFSSLPFNSATLHRAPHHWGPANPLYAEPTGYASTMVGIPYDDLKTWRSVFPADLYIAKMRETSAAFEAGAAAWRDVIAKTDGAARATAVRELGIIRTIALHYASAADQAAFVLARDRGDREGMAEIARRELRRAKELLPIVEADSRLGYECSCHYFYIPQDLREKIVNCRQIIGSLSVL